LDFFRGYDESLGKILEELNEENAEDFDKKIQLAKKMG
jgi:hypothetical protein